MINNYYRLVEALKKVALMQPNVVSTSDTDIYQLNSEEFDYIHFCVTPGEFQVDNSFEIFTLNLYIVERLNYNVLQIHSEANDLLLNIIKQFEDLYPEVSVEEPYSIKPFEQTFSDITAGCFATVKFTLPLSYCFEDYTT